MANTLVDLVKVYATNTGTGPFILGNAVPSFRGVEALNDGDHYGYSIRQGSNYEVGTGVYSLSLGTLSRVVETSSNGGSPINLAPNAVVNFPALAADIGRPGPAGADGPPGPQGPAGANAIITDWVRTTFTATAGQTSFAVAYTVGYCTVYLNGVLLSPTDYTASTGTTVVLGSAAAVGDLVDVITATPSTGYGGLVAALNLSDLADPAAARANLGLATYIFSFAMIAAASASEVLSLHVAGAPFTIPANFASAIRSAVGTNPTATFAIDVQQQVGGAGAFSSIGTISVATSGTVTATTASGTLKSIAAGDVLKFVAPVTPDATAANMAFTIIGVR